MIYIQFIGLLAFCILVLSFYKKDVKMILTYQATSCFIYSIHYFLLGGLTGAFINFINIFRSVVFINSRKKIYVPIFILFYLIVTIIFYENIYSFVPIVATSSYLVFMPYNNKKYLLIGEIISASLWLIYALSVLSYSGIVTEIILVISNLVQLINLQQNKDIDVKTI